MSDVVALIIVFTLFIGIPAGLAFGWWLGGVQHRQRMRRGNRHRG